jgi:sigma-E factor negative regulatory protein RseA
MMRSANGYETQSLERLSALMDGEADASAVQACSDAWRDDVASRAAWHAYHLIGDVLRSEDLASAPQRDAAFVAALRARLDGEPALLAPSAGDTRVATRPLRRASRWRAFSAPAAVAAGFVAVGGAVLVLRSPPATVPASLAQAGAPLELRASAPSTQAPLAAVAEAPAAPLSGQMIRDARLQQYLAAHKQFGGSTALGVPSGFLRSATVDVPVR